MTPVQVALGFGLFFVLAGIALLLQELELLVLRWTYVLPAMVVTVGVALLMSGIAQAHRAHRGTMTDTPGPFGR
ncbi:MAG TPA: hypothetical protein VIC62_15275 [Nakamurella sp.]|jgi:hypothetical protein